MPTPVEAAFAAAVETYLSELDADEFQQMITRIREPDATDAFLRGLFTTDRTTK